MTPHRPRPIGFGRPSTPSSNAMRNIGCQPRNSNRFCMILGIAHGRRLAYELLCTCDGATPSRLLPTMLNDPMRRIAIRRGRGRFYQGEIGSGKLDRGHCRVAEVVVEPRGMTIRLNRSRENWSGVANRWTSLPISVTSCAGKWREFSTTPMAVDSRRFSPEHRVDLAAKYAGKNGVTTTWRPITVTDKNGAIDLNRVFPDPAGKTKGQKAAVAYAYAEVESPVDRAIEVRAASATAIKVFVNGREVLARESYHQSFDRDMYTAPARLTKGRNTILVKVCQNDQSEAWRKTGCIYFA